MMFGSNSASDETAKRIPFNSTGIEIGVWKGETSAKFLKRCGFLHMVDAWSVEPYSADPEYLGKYAPLAGGSSEEAFVRKYESVYAGVVERFGGDMRCRIHRMTSARFFRMFEGLDAGWIYIDGDHSFEGCLDDLEGSLKVLRRDGTIFGDDFGNKPGVTAALKVFTDRHGLDAEVFGGNQYEIRL